MARRKSPPGRILFLDDHRYLEECFGNETRARIISALMAVGTAKEIDPLTLSSKARFAYYVLRDKILIQAANYDEVCRRNSAAAKQEERSGKQSEPSRTERYSKEKNEQTDVLPGGNKKKKKDKTITQKGAGEKETAAPPAGEAPPTPDQETAISIHQPDDGVQCTMDAGAENRTPAVNAAARLLPAAADQPTPEQVQAYAASRGRQIDAKRFCNHYAALGWRMNGQVIYDWRPLADRWTEEDAGRQHAPQDRSRAPRPTVNAQRYTQRTYTEAQLSNSAATLLAEAAAADLPDQTRDAG